MYTKIVQKWRYDNDMKITREADYAVRIVYALMQAQGVMPASEISERTGVTLRFALKILRKLAAAGIVASQKGAQGGYRLLADPAQLSLAQIIECIDGPFEISHCLNREVGCTHMPDKESCRFRQVFDQVSTKLRQELDQIKMTSFKDE